MWNPPIRERGQGGVFSAKDPPKKARKKRKRLDEADALPTRPSDGLPLVYVPMFPAPTPYNIRDRRLYPVSKASWNYRTPTERDEVSF